MFSPFTATQATAEAEASAKNDALNALTDARQQIDELKRQVGDQKQRLGLGLGLGLGPTLTLTLPLCCQPCCAASG